MSSTNPVGKTKGQGWEIGVRRTLPIDLARAWRLLFTQPGLGWWFGTDPKAVFEKGYTYQTREGIAGKIKSYVEGNRIRMSWQPRRWD